MHLIRQCYALFKYQLMGRRQKTTLLMLRFERQEQKSGECSLKGDLHLSFYWNIIYTIIMKRILIIINFCILVG